MRTTLNSIGVTAGCLLVIVGIFALIAFIFAGGVWLGKTILPLLAFIALLVLALDIFVLFPLSMSKRSRSASGAGLFLSSYVYGATAWLWSLVLVDAIWGIGMVIVGVLFAGIGVIPLAIIATSVNSAWGLAGQIIFLVALAYGTRTAGRYLSAGGPDNEPPRAPLDAPEVIVINEPLK